MTRPVQTPYLPPDREAYVQAEPPTGRVIVIAPTRAACETIELALGLHIETFLEKHHGERVRALARSGQGFGIVAGTGTGKTLAIRPIAEEILGSRDLRVGVVNREREATPETPTWNVIIVTTGIARRWFEENDILKQDTIIVDEIHQTSAELELCLALGKRTGCRFVWLSATVDPKFYARYLDSADHLQVYEFDPSKAAKVRVVNSGPVEFLGDKFLQQIVREKRGVAAFVPTRKGVEQIAEQVQLNAPRINTAFYHGGEPIRILRPFLEGGEKKPYFLAMTAAGQSALNVRGLDTVIIDDKRFFTIVDRGRNVLTQEHLGANEILQMAGRVHGRVEGGRVFILSDRDIQFEALTPTEPEFQLAGDSERVAITCAALGVRADELELPVPLDKVAYRKAVELLERRGLVDKGRLTPYGRAVEAMPVERAWAELLVNADDELIPFLAVMASIESLHRMTREERDLNGIIVPGSDHLTAYNLYAEAFHAAGRMGEVYGLPRHLFDEERVDQWAERRGVLVKSVEDAALGMASIYRSLGLQLPARMPNAGEGVLRKFQQLLAQFMPFTLVIDEETATGEEARVSKTSVCGSWGPIAGELRYFADKFGVPRASIEGTQVPLDLLRQYATHGEAELLYDPERRRTPLAVRRKVEYFGFELERDVEGIEEFPPELAAQARRVLAESLARQQARHHAVKRNRVAVEELREAWRRSGGTTPRLGQAELTAWYEERLARVNSLEEFRATDLTLDPETILPRAELERWLDLPDLVELRGKEIAIDYDVEETNGAPVAVARLRLPEKMARTLSEEELPSLDRPIRFTVTRGQRGAVRASTLEELQDLLDRPWTQEEVEAANRERDARRDASRTRRQQKRMHEAKRELKRGRDGQRQGGELRGKEHWERGQGGGRKKRPGARGARPRDDRARGATPRGERPRGERPRGERTRTGRARPAGAEETPPRNYEAPREWQDGEHGRRQAERRRETSVDEPELREDRKSERRSPAPTRDERTD
ncbi:MAG TPA: DEAD/DEAH box helicase [Gemmatimonadaceae bacterium]|nr:DEAD/DEAH box helicase [Gemmatimonadaceae bacterium]